MKLGYFVILGVLITVMFYLSTTMPTANVINEQQNTINQENTAYNTKDTTINTDSENTQNTNDAMIEKTEDNAVMQEPDDTMADDTTTNTGDDTMTVILETTKGNIEIELDNKKAPISVQNFLNYVNEGYYDGLIFHRVIKGFMVQGGGFTPDMVQKEPKAPIKNEADNGLKNDKYTIAMARTAVVDSATSQFFINTASNDFLNNGARDFGYAVFGKVVSGTEVVDAIDNVATGRTGGFSDVPVEPVIITKAYVKNN